MMLMREAVRVMRRRSVMHAPLRRVALVAFGALFAAQAGCAHSHPTRFYVLTSMVEAEERGAEGGTDAGVAVGVGPVELPGYLDRPQIVTRAGTNELEVAEFHCWAEPLRENVSRVLAEDLSVLIPASRIALFPPGGSAPIDYRLVVKVGRFEGTANGEGLLAARWSIFARDGKSVIRAGSSSFNERVGEQGHHGTVSALNRALAAFSREIARAIEEVSGGTADR